MPTTPKVATVRTRILLKVSKKGYTLIEMSAVIVVLAVAAALVTPRLLTMRASREVATFWLKLPDLAVLAREHAQSARVTTRVKYDDGQKLFRVVEDDSSTSTSSNGPLQLPSSDDSDQSVSGIKDLPVPDGLEPQNFRVEDESTPSSDWSIVFYPDGRSDGAALEVDDHGRIHSVIVDPDGSIRATIGSLPAADERKWSAGEREQRA